MSETVDNATSFVKQVIAGLKGDNAKATAIKNERRARAALNSQLSTLDGNLVEAEELLAEAKEKLSKAIFVEEWTFSTPSGYISALKSAQAEVEDKEEKLDDIKESIIYYKGIVASFK